VGPEEPIGGDTIPDDDDDDNDNDDNENNTAILSEIVC
jgi:hypothetical protein